MNTRVLLVDNNQTFISAVRLFFDMLPGATVVGEAHDGPDALVKVGQLQPDLVMLDIAMPGMHGLEVARHLQSLPQPPRVILLSMYDDPEYRIAASELGVEDFVNKAFFVTDLFPIMERLTRARSGGEPAA